MYKWHKVRVLREKGVSIKGIARSLKLSKNTVRKYLRDSGPPQFKAREYERKLDRFEEEVLGMVSNRYIGTRIFKELVEIGYDGSLATVHRYLRGLRREEDRLNLSTTRVETAPGKQMQYDWKEWYLPVRDRLLKVYIHEVVLSYSRKKYYTFSLSITCQDIIRAIEGAIHFFGGVAGSLVIDNPKQMVITHGRDGIVRYNDEFLRFCGLYGIEPSPCCPYRARTKGKAERPFYYLQEHLLRGLRVEDLGEFEERLRVFMVSYNARLHSTLKESPDEMFEREKGSLRGFERVEPVYLYEREVKKVSSDGYIRFRGGLYPVPMYLCLEEVFVEQVMGRHLKVYDKRGEVVSEQEVHLFEDGKRHEHPEHEEMNVRYREKRERKRSQVVRSFAETFGDVGIRYTNGLRSEVGANLYWHLKEILDYLELYEARDIQDILHECISIGSYHKNSVKRLLEGKRLKSPSLEITNIPNRHPVQGITRDLSVYGAILEVGHE